MDSTKKQIKISEEIHFTGKISGTHPAVQQNKLKNYERNKNSTNNKIYRTIQTKLERRH
jgi:hypothetical protein